MIPYGRQDVSEADIDAVIDVLRSEFLTQGPKVPKFERDLCGYTGAQYAKVVNSCTSALHLACIALGLGEGDALWTSAITFVASSNCALYCGASVDFVDVDPDTALMSVAKLEKKLKQAKQVGMLPKVVVPVHFAGQPCDMEQIYALGAQYGFKIIEDAAHAIGASYGNETVGNCRYSDITVFSFHPVKIVTSGEGGAILTNDPQIDKRVALLRSHGVTRDQLLMAEKSHGSWYYEQVDLGFNYRITDFQAALGSSQMVRLDEYVERRKEISCWYDSQLAELPIRPLSQLYGRNSAHHLYVVRVEGGEINKERFHNLLREEGIASNLHYIPVYRHPYYRTLQQEKRVGFEWLEGAEEYYAGAVTLPIFPTMTDGEKDKVVAMVKKACGNMGSQ